MAERTILSSSRGGRRDLTLGSVAHKKNGGQQLQTQETDNPRKVLERLSRSTLNQIVCESGVCLECGGAVRQRDSDNVCVQCGTVWGRHVSFDVRIPFSEKAVSSGHAEDHFSPVNELAFNRNLGVNQWISNKAFTRIICEKGDRDAVRTNDVGMRANLLRIVTSQRDHPLILKFLGEGSQLCNQYGYGKNVFFSNYYGRLLRKIVAHYVVRNIPEERLAWVPKAVFAWLYCSDHPTSNRDIIEELGLKRLQVEWIVAKLKDL